MREVTFTLFASARARSGNEITMPWKDWVALFSKHEQRGSVADSNNKTALDQAKNGPAILLGTLAPGGTRNNESVTSIHALGIDVEDHTPEQVTQALSSIDTFEHIIWTTHKHGSEVANGYPRLRVIVPLKAPISPEQARSAWARLNAMVGGINDKQTKDPARLHFLPSTFDPSVCWHYRNAKDAWLDLSDLPTPQQTTLLELDDPGIARRVNKLRWQLSNVSKSDPIRPLASMLVGGAALAQTGKRHNAIRDLTMWLAMRNAHIPRSVLTALFSPSIYAMQKVDPEDCPDEDEVWTAYEGAASKVIESDTVFDDERKKQIQLQQAGESSTYDDDDLRRIARLNGWMPDELKNRWMIQREGAYWFLNAEGRYMGPFVKEDAAIAARTILSRSPVSLVSVTQNGFRWRPLPDVVTEYGQIATKIMSDLTVQRTRFDPTTGVIHEAVSPLRDLSPQFDQQIDQWLKLLAGPQYGKLVDWLSCVIDLNKLLCAVYFSGASGAGKTLFAHGVSHLWTEGPPTEVDAMLADFNEDLIRCPIVFGDEEMPQRFGKMTATTALRAALGVTHRTLKRKYKPPTELRGAVRLILADNPGTMLGSKDVANQQDLTAIAQRFLFINALPDAAEYLESLPRETRVMWGEEGIARHALWLAANHEVKRPGKRFWVEGAVSAMHRLLITGSRWNSLVCEWLARYLMNPKPHDAKGNFLIRIDKRELLVNDQAIIDGWDLYIQEKRVDPNTTKIASALRAISNGRRQVRPGKGLPGVRYRIIDTDHIFVWSNENNVGDVDTMKATLASDTTSAPAPDNVRSIR